MRHVAAAVVVLCSLSVAGAQSPADGTWNFVLTSPMGTVEAKVEMKTEGESLAGTFDLGGGREWPIQNGVVTGDEIAFTLDRPGAMTYEMKGTIKGDTVEGTAHAMGATVEWSMSRAR